VGARGHAPQPLPVRAGAEPFAALTAPLTLRAWDAPVSDESVAIGPRRPIGAAEPLRTGTYSTLLTFTLSTTTP
jgi:hypothetical protein